MQVSLASRRSPDAATNEDFIAATAGAVVVVDGASVPSGLATGCRHGTAWFAHQLGVQLLALLSAAADHSPADGLAQAITEVAALHADTCDLSHPGSPSATVAILREQPDTVDYLVLGDTTILLEEPAGLRVVTDDRLEQVAAIQHSAMHQHATGSADHARSFAELVTEQRRHRNHPDGFWVASTNPSARPPRSDRHRCPRWPATGGRAQRRRDPGWSTASTCSTGHASWTSWPSRDQTRSSPRSERLNTATRTGNAGRVASDTTTPPLSTWRSPDRLNLGGTASRRSP
jgi:hypothetical protein